MTAPPLASHRPWLLRRPSPEHGARLFCFPYSGCGGSMYRYWPVVVGDVEVCPIQLPGRENRTREPHYGTYEALADAVCDGLEPFLDRGYAFFGHCSGALIAYEVTMRLAERGMPVPTQLFLSSQPPPNAAATAGFTAMSEAEVRSELVRLVEGMGGKPTDELLELYLSVYVPDLEAARGYRRSTPVPPATRVTVVSWVDSGVPVDRLAEWRGYADASIVDLPGGHYDFLAAPGCLTTLLTTWRQPTPAQPISTEPS